MTGLDKPVGVLVGNLDVELFFHRHHELDDVEAVRAQIVDVSSEVVMIEISGKERKIEAFIELMRPFGIVELVRSGRIAMVRGHNPQQEALNPEP